jgi:hypothetical protein
MQIGPVTLSNTTPGEAWEGFVGSQTPIEFMSYTPGLTPKEATQKYVNDPTFAGNFLIRPGKEADTIAELLSQYIEKDRTWQLKSLIGKEYTSEIVDRYDWSHHYPVVSNGKIIAIYDAANAMPREYQGFPVIDDVYISPDGLCIMVDRSDSGGYSIPGAASVEWWVDVRGDASEVERLDSLVGWGIWDAVYLVTVYEGDDPYYYFVNEG